MKDKQDKRRSCVEPKRTVSTPPPSFDSLVDFLYRRLTPSFVPAVITALMKCLIHFVLFLLGFKGAQKRLEESFKKKATKAFWYSPRSVEDSFGIRVDEPYLQSMRSQVLHSYAVVISGTKFDRRSSVVDGLVPIVHDENTSVGHNNSFPRSTLPDVLLNAAYNPMVHRATSLVMSMLKLRSVYTRNIFSSDEMFIDVELCSRIFSCSLQFHKGGVAMRYKASRSYSRHIVVLIGGHMYEVEVLRTDVLGDEVPPTFEEIKRQFERVLQQHQQSRSTPQIGPLTVLPPAERCTEEHLIKNIHDTNIHNLEILRDALFIVCLDSDNSPRRVNEAMFALHSGNFVNRWYDKSVQLVVFGNGVAGFVFNYLAGIVSVEGTNFARFVAEKEEELTTSFLHIGPVHDQIKLKELRLPSLLQCHDTPTNELSKKIQTRVVGLFKPAPSAVFKLTSGMTQEEFTSRDVSPSGVFQAALQLALLRMSGEYMNMFETAGVRNQTGLVGEAWIETDTADMKKFVQAANENRCSNSEESADKNIFRLKKLLKTALKSYSHDVQRHCAGEISLWHFDALWDISGLRCSLPEQDGNSPSLIKYFQRMMFVFLRKPSVNFLPPKTARNLCINQSWSPLIEAVGRAGMECFLQQHGMVLQYVFGESMIAVNVSTGRKHPCYGKHEELIRHLEEAFTFIKMLLKEKIN